MGFKMKDLNQLIIKFDYDQNFKDQDFYVSKSNEYSFKLLNSWPKWEKNFLNLIGEKFSGKTHLINIFLKKFKGIKIEASNINNHILKEIKIYENIVVENLNKDINENLFYTLLNIIEQDNKYLIVTSKKPIVDFSYKLNDLNCSFYRPSLILSIKFIIFIFHNFNKIIWRTIKYYFINITFIIKFKNTKIIN